MTASIVVDSISLNYRLPRKISLSPSRRRTATGGRIDQSHGKSVVTALDNVSFEIAHGDRVGIVGSNGSGKTTLLKVLYGVYTPSSGYAEINGRVDALFNINVGFRPQATGRRNIVLRGLINGWSQQQIASRLEEIIEFSELGDFIDLPLKSYSQGMSARLAFATATALEPDILLMDEWIGAGDPGFQQKARARMQDLADRAGIVVLASHNHKLLRQTCNKVLHLDHGSLSYFGDAEEYFVTHAT